MEIKIIDSLMADGFEVVKVQEDGRTVESRIFMGKSRGENYQDALDCFREAKKRDRKPTTRGRQS